MDAIILAGALNKGPLRDCSSSPYEAGIEVAGRPMVELVIEALVEVKRIRRIVVAIPDGILSPKSQSKVWKTVPHGVTMLESLAKAFEVLQPEEPVLVLTSDIPLLTPAAVEDFLQRCEERPADIHYSFVSKEVNEAKYPGVRRTYVRLKDGTFTGGNIVRFHPIVLRDHSRRIAQAIALRKKPIELCKMLGFLFVLKFLVGQLTVGEIEGRVENILQLKAAGIVSPYPEVGIDVDKPSDLELARKALAQ